MYDEERPYEVIPNQLGVGDRRRIWDTAKGMQAVDNLEVSDYADDVGEKYVSGEYDSAELQRQIESHYKDARSRQSEADVVSTRITALLESADTSRFETKPATLRYIHRMLFKDQLQKDWVGVWRKCDIRKEEPVLGGRSVEYISWNLIPETLSYDFEENSSVDYGKMDQPGNVADFADFIARIWEVHPFREGNTRTVATFSQLYLAQYGIKPGNDYFRDYSTWFRDALVRASYSKISEGIEADSSFLERFFENIVLDAGHDLDAMDLNRHGIRIGDTPYRPAPETRSWNSIKERVNDLGTTPGNGMNPLPKRGL